tara:strand:+ start:1012 stop:1263 length:252 start_codon:yes stop_codon:yes gene_type:complete
MPTYSYACTSCDKEFDLIVKISDRMNAEKKPCPSCGNATSINYIMRSPKIVTGVGSLLSKTDNGWKEVLSKIKSNLVINNIHD